MASIKMISIKKVVKYRGHEGEALSQGDICFKNKKIGFYREGDWGGNMEIHIDENFRDKFNEISKEYFKDKEKPFDWYIFNNEDFMYEVIKLQEEEKIFKKYMKLPIIAVGITDSHIYTIKSEDTTRELKKKYPNIMIYSNLEQFKK